MAFLTNTKISGINISNAYISILKKRDQKIYEEQEDGSYIERNITWVHIGGAVDRNSWISGDRFNMNHTIHFDGELKKVDIYPLLKQLTIPQYEIDFKNSIDVLE